MKVSTQLPQTPIPSQFRSPSRAGGLAEQPITQADPGDSSVLSAQPEACSEAKVGAPAAADETSAAWKSALKTIDGYKGSFLVLGFGSKRQYKEPEAVQRALDQLVEGLDAEYGKSRWLVVFGGDPYKPEAPDVAAMVKYLQDQHGVPVMAIQSDKVKEWGGVDSHIDHVHYVPTTYRDSQIVWGGFVDGQPAGPTAAYLGDDMVGGKNRRLKGVIALGGGEIAGQEALFAREKGVPVHYIRAEARLEGPGGNYGAIDSMLG